MMTFEELCELEPGLKDLHIMARTIQDNGKGKIFCANLIWYNLLKPKMYDLVGWGRIHAKERTRREHEIFVRKNPKLAEMFIRLDIPEAEGIEILNTSQAYDVAYQAIYDQLPVCRNC